MTTKLEAWKTRRMELDKMASVYNQVVAQLKALETQMEAKKIELRAAEVALLEEKTDGDAH